MFGWVANFCLFDTTLIISIDNIPPEISRKGHEAINAFVKNLQSGHQKYYHARGMVVGCAGAGKTTLLEMMKSQNIPDVTDETRSLHVHECFFYIDNEQIYGNIYITVYRVLFVPCNFRPSSLANCFALVLNSITHTCSCDWREIFYDIGSRLQIVCWQQIKVETGKNKMVHICSYKYITSNQQILQKCEYVFSLEGVLFISLSQLIIIGTLHSSTIYMGNAFTFAGCNSSESLNDVWNNNSYKNVTEQTISLLDFAGKCGYYETHPTFFNQRSFLILVIDLTKPLDSVVEDTGSEGTSFEHWTYKGRNRWLIQYVQIKILCLMYLPPKKSK